MSAAPAHGSGPLAAAAGLFAGPLAWAANTQTNYALAGWACALEFPIVPVIAACFF